jgi:hypothetical protein
MEGNGRDCPRCGRAACLRDLRDDEDRALRFAFLRGATPEEAARAVAVRCAM